MLQLTVDSPEGPKRTRHATYPDTHEGRELAERDRRIIVGVEASGYYQAPSGLTLGEYLAGWLDGLEYEVAIGQLRPSTVVQYRTDMESKIMPRLGNVPLTEITSRSLQRLYSDLLASGSKSGKSLKAKSVRNFATTLRRALADAVDNGQLKTNPAAGVKLPKPERAAIKTWTPDQTRYALANLEEPLRSMVFLTSTTAMRRSEVLGLQWDSVDLTKGMLDVRTTLIPIANKPTFTSMTKTDSSRRRIALDPSTIEMLRRHRARQAEARLSIGQFWSNDLDLVFTDEIGRPFAPDRFTRLMQSEAKRLRLPPIGVQGLRHSLATTALADGIPAKVVADRLGHASVATTLDRYSHVSEEQDRDAAIALAARIVGDQR